MNPNEKKYGFSEAILSKKTNEKIPFFFLGPDNDWKKILPEDMKTRLNQIYEKNHPEFERIFRELREKRYFCVPFKEGEILLPKNHHLIN